MDQSSEHDTLLGDFVSVLKRRQLLPPAVTQRPDAEMFVETRATTILGFKIAGAVLVAGDRRATAGNIVMYDRADKVLEIDRHSVMAIAGSPATAWEMARVLEHSFQFYRRSQLQDMSVEGKVRALSKLLRDNLGMVVQGLGVVVPLFATFEHKAADPAKLYFYDAMGAQFEATDFASSGSGAPSVRSVLYYENNWGTRPLRERSKQEAITLALKALDTAAESDTATGGVDRHGKIFPIIKIVSETGIETVADAELSELFQSELA
ncbi:MAG: proteasome subunit alpha [Verrucomicrobia bacterium]|nr:proteasome subunit alpha [Verrucomicrobiota bacterium]MBV9673862.1 proteasome subunit alpha [Verrucomicrobiota bacterium]